MKAHEFGRFIKHDPLHNPSHDFPGLKGGIYQVRLELLGCQDVEYTEFQNILEAKPRSKVVLNF